MNMSLPSGDIELTCSEPTTSKLLDDKRQIESIAINDDDSMPNVELKGASSKGSYTLLTNKSKNKKDKVPKVKKDKETKTKKDKKPGLFASMFCHSGRKPKPPALNLPPVDCEPTANNRLSDVVVVQQHADPLHVPNVDLPKPDILLPTFDRPEVNMASGQMTTSSEFSIPVVDLPPIPDLQLSNVNEQSIESNIDLASMPRVELPEVQLSVDQQQNLDLPVINAISIQKESLVDVALTSNVDDALPELPVIPSIEHDKHDEHLSSMATGLALSLPVDSQELSLETDHVEQLDPSQIETVSQHDRLVIR
jgi:hypothetical protein